MSWTTYNSNLPPSVKIDGKDLREFGLELIEYPDTLFVPTIDRRTLSIPGQDGVLDLGANYVSKEFTLTFQVWASSHQEAVAKRDAFLRWIQLPINEREYLVSGYKVRAHRLELIGHRYEYSEGTVYAAAGSKTVTGTGTEWLGRVFPGDILKITAVSERTITKVLSDTELTVSEAIPIEVNTTYSVTTRRVLLVNLSGNATVTPLTQRGMFKNSVYQISVPLIALYPFWLGDQVIIEEDDVASGTFLEIVQPGNAYSNPVVEVETDDTAENIKIASAKYAAFLPLDQFDTYQNGQAKNLLREDIDIFVPESVKFISANGSTGIGLSGKFDGNDADTVTIPVMADEESPTSGVGDRLDLSQGTIRVEFTPNWDGSDSESHIFIDAGSSVFRLTKNSSNQLALTVDGVTASASASSIVAGTTYVATGVWGTSGGSFFVDLYLDDARLDAETGTATGSTLPSTLYIGSSVNGVNSADSVIHSVCIWNVPIETRGATPTDDLADLCTAGTDPSSVHPEHITALFDFTDETAGTVATGYQEGDCALRFDGDNVYVDAPASDSFNFDQELTVEFWMKPEYKSGYQSVVDKVWNNGWGVLFYQNRYLSFHYATGQSLAIASAFNWNEWVHVAFTFTTEELKGYINGVFRSSKATGVNLTLTPTQPIRIGRNIGGIYQYLGEISYCRVYNRALSESEIQQLYSGADPQDVLSDYSTVCVLDYRFDRSANSFDSTTKQVLDHSSYGNDSEDITTTGFTWNGSYPDELVRSWTGLVGQAGKPRQESVTAISTTTITVGNADGFAANDRVCVWDTDGDKVVTTISSIDFNEEDDDWDITVADDCSSVSGTTRYISRNLLADPSIENTTSFWTAANATISADTTYYHIGTQSLRVTNSYATCGWASQSIAVTAGENYILRGWARMNQSGTTTVVRAWDATAGSAIAAISSSHFTAGEWTYFERAFEIPTGCTSLEIHLMVGTTTASHYTSFDGLQLVKQLADGDCEDAGDWTAGNAALSTIARRNGGLALSVRATSDGGRAYQIITPLNKGDWYLFKGWMKSSAAGHRVRLRVTRSSDGSLIASSDYVDSTDWTDYSVIFQAPSDSAGVILNCQVESSGETGYFDDIQLIRVDDIPLQIEPMDSKARVVSAKHDLGVTVTDSNSIVAENVIGSKYESTLTLRFRPEFDSDNAQSEDRALAKWVDEDGDNGYVISYDHSNNCFQMEVYSGGSVVYTVTSNTHDFSAGSAWVEVTFTYDYSDEDSCLFLINGIEDTASTSGSLTALSANPTRFIVPEHAWITVDEVVLAVKALDDDEICANYIEYETTNKAEFVFSPRAVHYTGSITNGDRLTFNFEDNVHTKYSVSTGLETSIINDLNETDAILLMTPESDSQNWFYIETDSGEVNIKLKFRPHYL